MARELVKILGIGVDSFSEEEALNHIIQHRGQVVTVNPEMISNAQKDSSFMEIVNNAQLVIPDGIGVEIGLKILGYNVKRIAGIEFGKKLLNYAQQSGETVALIGAKPEILSLATNKIKEEFPFLNIVYTHDGYFSDDGEIIQNLENSCPDILLVALGSPKQEIFINKAKNYLPNSIMIGLGGSFDVWSGVVKRAPLIYRKLGLEWLYRTVKEPQRFRRIFPVLPLFIINVIIERFNNKE